MRNRLLVSALSLSAAGLVGIVIHEGYSDTAYDDGTGVETIGFGTTTRPDGSPVRMGDMTTPPKALDRALRDVRKFEGAIKDCVKVPLAQHEYDFAVSFSYNVGAFAFCNSTIVKRWNAGDYEGGCDAIMMWTYAAGKDCRDRANNCYGLIVRREAERKQCLGLS